MLGGQGSAQGAGGGGGGGGGPGEFIGALISLISKSDIRYQGYLAQIDPNAATVALEQVRSFGSEGRLAAQGRPDEEIPPAPPGQMFDFVTFRAADVKDLKIDEANPDRNARERQNQQQQGFVDPAILGSSRPPPHHFGGPPPPGQYGGPGGPGGPWGPSPLPLHGAGPYGGYGPPPNAGFMPPQFGGPPPPGHYPGGPMTPQQRPPPPSQQQQQQQQQQIEASKGPSGSVSPSKPIPTGPKALSPGQSRAQAANGASPVPTGPRSAQPASASNATQVPKASAVHPHATPKSTADSLADDLANKAKISSTVESKSASGVPAPVPAKPSTPSTSTAPSAARLPARPQAPTSRPPRGPPTSVFDDRSGASGPTVPKGDFDFESANARFNKEKLEAEKQSGLDDTTSFYDKSSFFDNISSEVRDRYDQVSSSASSAGRPRGGHVSTGFDGGANGSGGGGGGGGRGRGRGGARQARFEEDRKNLDTFGEVGSSGRGRGRGGPRGGGGRGGRGRGRGGPRGGARGGSSVGGLAAAAAM